LPQHDPLETDNGRIVVLHRHRDAAAVTIDTAAKADFVAPVFGDDVAAGSAGVEFAGPVAILDAETE